MCVFPYLASRFRPPVQLAALLSSVLTGHLLHWRAWVMRQCTGKLAATLDMPSQNVAVAGGAHRDITHCHALGLIYGMYYCSHNKLWIKRRVLA